MGYLVRHRLRPAEMLSKRWELFEHGADVGVRGFGESLDEAFEAVALALTGVITDPGTVKPSESVRIECSAPDSEVLLVDWLNAIIYEMATRNMLFGEYDVRIEDGKLTAIAKGEKVDVSRHEPTVEVKGATYTCLRVDQQDGIWRAECVVDV